MVILSDDEACDLVKTILEAIESAAAHRADLAEMSRNKADR
jgi:hypothetical protein